MTRVRLRGEQVIQGTAMTINLDITLQSKFSWKDHISKIKSKVIKSLGLLSSIIVSIWSRNFLALRKIFKVVIVFNITYRASIQLILNKEKRYCKTLILQLTQVQIKGAHIITRAFIVTFVQVLNIETYLTPITLELDKKADQIAAWLYLGPIYLTII